MPVQRPDADPGALSYLLDRRVHAGGVEHDLCRLQESADVALRVDALAAWRADGYEDSQEIVDKALKGRRDSVVPATKFSRAMGEDPNRQGTSRRWIMTAVEDSLRRL